MATHPIGKGTKNLAVNLPESARSALGRLAFVRDVSIGCLVKRLIAAELLVAYKNGEIAEDAIDRALADLRKGILGVFVFLSLAGLSPRVARRTPRGPAVCRVVKASRKIGEWGLVA